MNLACHWHHVRMAHWSCCELCPLLETCQCGTPKSTQFGVLTLGFQSSHMESMLPALPEPWFHHGNNCGIKVELPQCIYIYHYISLLSWGKYI
jgi:hypothetical protein